MEIFTGFLAAASFKLAPPVVLVTPEQGSHGYGAVGLPQGFYLKVMAISYYLQLCG